MHATWYRGRPRPRPHCATWGPTSRHRKRAQPPIFGPCLLWPNGWMDQDATWCVGRPWPIVLDGTTKKGHCSPLFSAHVDCGHGCTSQLLLSSCYKLFLLICLLYLFIVLICFDKICLIFNISLCSVSF